MTARTMHAWARMQARPHNTVRAPEETRERAHTRREQCHRTLATISLRDQVHDEHSKNGRKSTQSQKSAPDAKQGKKRRVGQ
eukprot:5530844-Pyramimonas_sp.AAC.1